MWLLSGRGRRAVLSLFSVVAVLGCGSDGPSVVLPLTAVTIRSLHADGSPLDAEFFIKSESETSGFSAQVRTEGGIAEFTLPAGSYTITDWDHETFYSASGPVMDEARADLVEVGGQRSLDIAFRYASASIRLRSPGGERVMWDSSGPRPILFPSPRIATIRTDGDSLLLIGPLPVGDYLFASDPFDPNWPTTWHPSAPTFVTAQQVRLSSGQSRSVEITLLPPAFMIFDCPTPDFLADWTPHHCVILPGLATEPGDSTVRRCFLDSASFEAGPFVAGAHEYQLELRWEGPNGAHATRYVEGRATWMTSNPARVGVTTTTGLEVMIDPASADLTLFDDDGHALASSHGSPAFLLAEPGQYRLVGMNRGRWRTYWPAAKFYLGGSRLEVTEGVRRFEWSLMRSGSVSGRVLVEDDDGYLVPCEAVVRIQGMSWSRGFETRFGGYFIVEDVWPDEYRLLAEPYRDDAVPTWFGNTTERDSAATFRIATGEHLRDLEIRVVRR